MRRVLPPLVLLSVTLCLGCSEDATSGPDPAAAAEGELVEPPFEVSGEAEDLVLTWYDEEGPHLAERRSDIPEEHREHVRVDSLQLAPEERDPDHVYVADLRAEQGGRYPVRRYSREAFDAVVERAMGVPEQGGEQVGSAPVAEATALSHVIIYGASWCGACRAAAAHLRRRGVPFEEKDIERDPGARAEMQRKARAAGVRPSGIPVIDFRGTILTGFDQRRIDQLIGQSATHTL